MLMIRIIVERPKRKQSKAGALNLKQSARFSVSCCSLLVSCIPINSNYKVMRLRENIVDCFVAWDAMQCIAGHRLSAKSNTIDSSPQKSNKISFEEKLLEYYGNFNHSVAFYVFIFVLSTNLSSLFLCPHFWRIHFGLPWCLCSSATVIHGIHDMMRERKMKRWFISDKRS